MFNETTASSLYAEVERSPFDLNVRKMYADYITGEDDPRGRFIIEQCKPASEQDQDLITRLLAEHGRNWTAQDLGIQESNIPAGSSVEFHQGFAWWPIQAEYSNFQAAIDAGHYNEIDTNITAVNFCLEDLPVSINAKLVIYAPHLTIKSPRVIYETRRRLHLNLNTDLIWELLALGATYPDIQLHFPIFALGSSWVTSDGDRNVPYLGRWDAKRYLSLFWFVDEWDGPCRFAATREQILAPRSLCL